MLVVSGPTISLLPRVLWDLLHGHCIVLLMQAASRSQDEIDDLSPEIWGGWQALTDNK
jgi:hypothetical protein